VPEYLEAYDIMTDGQGSIKSKHGVSGVMGSGFLIGDT
jgi:hypothetical protein